MGETGQPPFSPPTAVSAAFPRTLLLAFTLIVVVSVRHGENPPPVRSYVVRGPSPYIPDPQSGRGPYPTSTPVFLVPGACFPPAVPRAMRFRFSPLRLCVWRWLRSSRGCGGFFVSSFAFGVGPSCGRGGLVCVCLVAQVRHTATTLLN